MLQMYILKTVKPLKFVGISVRQCLDISLCAVTSIGRIRAWVCNICSSSKVQFDQFQRIWDVLAQRVWHSGGLQSSSSLSFFLLWWCPLLSGRELALWSSLARLLLGLLMIITGVTGERGAEFHSQSGQKSSLQHNCSWSCQTTAKEQLVQVQSSTYTEPVNSYIAAVHFVTYVFIHYFPFLIAFRLQINFVLKVLCYCCFLISSFLSCRFSLQKYFFLCSTLSCTTWFCPSKQVQRLVTHWLNSITRELLIFNLSLAVTKYLCL